MRSIRRRLTIGYVVALGLTLTLFGVVLYVDRRQADFQSLDDRLEVEAQLTLRMLRDLSRSLGRLPPVVESVQQYFQGFAHYLVLVGTDQNIILVIDPVGSMGNEAVGRLRELTNLVKDGTPTWTTTTIIPGQSPVRLYLAPVVGADPAIRYMLVGASLDEVSFGPAALLRSMLLVAPVVLLVSVVIGSWLAGTSLYPLESTIDELTAITDGRSLHRRLPVNPSGTDELTRLSQAVNGMFARLEQSFAAQQRFVAEASHELKTPLMVLRAGVERALTDSTTPNESLEALDQSLEEINRMSELVDSLLTLARADEGRVALAVETRDLRELVNEAAETAQILGEAKSLTIRSQVPDGPVPYPIDRTRMRQLLLNLVTNAVKYTPSGGGVTVSLTDEADVVHLIVADTGMGIAPGDLPHIFDRFWRADPARARDTGGTGAGLGLAITKWIAEAHGGSITVQSRPGKGAVFTVSLPRSGSLQSSAVA
ncbi:MAG: HAMP domain-containing protein [Gemmatimonadales bacterium]|nr:HAMP domain-containing protein [Gemmatimonadales bacterium]